MLRDQGELEKTSLSSTKGQTIWGFLVPDLIPKFAGKFFTEVPTLSAQGKIRSQEAIVQGLENAPEAAPEAALLDMLKEGGKVGKVVVIVAKE
ncbi:hypothetical protein PTI98_012018 [Pleurotus ostreatus]|nr:hypothetical protein PTI98_012018 [Pleurotus ostreatus]